MQKSNIDDDRLGILATSPLMARLRSLDLRKNSVTVAGADALLRARDLTRLRVLYMGGSALTADGKERMKDALAGTTIHL